MRDKLVKVMVLVVLASGIGYGTIHFTRQWLAAERAAMDEERRDVVVQAEPASLFVLVAKEDMAPGRFVQPSDVRWQAWPDDGVPGTYISRPNDRARFEDVEELVGTVTRAPVDAGQPIGTNQVVRPGDRGFLAAVLRPGMRAVTVQVDDRSGVAGLIHPGDRVDLVLGHSVTVYNEEDEDERVNMRVSETVMRDVRILALDRRLGPAGDNSRVPDTATLEVSPHQVEMVNLMGQVGSISFALRSLPHTRPDGSEVPDKRLPLITMTEPLSDVFATIGLTFPEILPGMRPERSFTIDREISSVMTIIDEVNSSIQPPEPLLFEDQPFLPEELERNIYVFRGSVSGGSSPGASTTTVEAPPLSLPPSTMPNLDNLDFPPLGGSGI